MAWSVATNRPGVAPISCAQRRPATTCCLQVRHEIGPSLVHGLHAWLRLSRSNLPVFQRFPEGERRDSNPRPPGPQPCAMRMTKTPSADQLAGGSNPARSFLWRVVALIALCDLPIPLEMREDAVEIVRLDLHRLRQLRDRDPWRRVHELRHFLCSSTGAARTPWALGRSGGPCPRVEPPLRERSRTPADASTLFDASRYIA
jgi:hypothetical protein